MTASTAGNLDHVDGRGLRIAVDGRSLVGGANRGVAHYLAALLRSWPAIAPQDELRVVLPRGGPVHARDVFGDGILPAPQPLPGRVLFTAAAATGRPRLDRLAGGCDVAWVVAPAPVAVSPGVPYVLTVHDRSWEARPQDFTTYERLWHRAARPRRLARRAERVVTTTRWGRDDVVAAWGLDPGRVDVVPLAPVVVPALGDDAAGPRDPTPTATTDDDAGPLLFVGALEPRKGPDVLAEALRLARSRGLARDLIVVGGGRLDGLLREPGVRHAAPVHDAALSALYAQASALVVPSRLEGFGLPAVEALAHGTPVIATDLPPVREVLGDAATYVPVDDPAALAAALLAEPPTAGARPPRTWTDVARETRVALEGAAR